MPHWTTDRPLALLDVNVLVALAWPNHVHHAQVVSWFSTNHALGWATTPITESGFVRVSSNRKAIPDAVPPATAIALLQQLTDIEGHVFWEDDISLARSELVARERIIGYRQVTDAHLVAMALRHEGRLVTLDRGVASVVPQSIEVDRVITVLS